MCLILTDDALNRHEFSEWPDGDIWTELVLLRLWSSHRHLHHFTSCSPTPWIQFIIFFLCHNEVQRDTSLKDIEVNAHYVFYHPALVCGFTKPLEEFTHLEGMYGPSSDHCAVKPFFVFFLKPPSNSEQFRRSWTLGRGMTGDVEHFSAPLYCVRHGTGMCSAVYELLHRRSKRLGTMQACMVVLGGGGLQNIAHCVRKPISTASLLLEAAI